MIQEIPGKQNRAVTESQNWLIIHLVQLILNHDFNRSEKQTESLVLESIRLALEKAKEKNMKS